MTFSISTFATRVGHPARPNLFEANLTLPEELKKRLNAVEGSGNRAKLGGSYLAREPVNGGWINKMSGYGNNFKFRVEATELPGRTLATYEDFNHGPSFKIPYDTTYNDLTFTIIASEDMKERILFEMWMEQIVRNTDLSGGLAADGGQVGWIDDWLGQIRVYQLGDDGNYLAKYIIQQCFPIQISGMNLSWEELNTYQRFTVTMSYRYHHVQFAN